MKQVKTTSFMTRTFVAVLGLMLVVGVALRPVRSEAYLLGTSVGVAYSVINGLSAVAFAAGAVTLVTQSEDAFWVGATACILGAVLDDSGQQKTVLNSINDDLAQKAGVSPAEQAKYNQELDLIQATFDDISAQVAPLSAEQRTIEARKLWDEYRSAFAPESFSAIAKVIKYASTQAQ